MDVSVRVISGGIEVDSITRPVRMADGIPMVTYRKQRWPVVNGCINLDENDAEGRIDVLDWAFLVSSLLPESLPAEKGACTELVQHLFNNALPEGVAIAVGHLCELGLESPARMLLVDFFSEKQDGPRLYKILKMRLLFRERLLQRRSNKLTASEHLDKQAFSASSATLPDFEDNLEWSPVADDELRAPDIDDSGIRGNALEAQSGIGVYRVVKDPDAKPLDLGDIEDLDWELNSDQAVNALPASKPEDVVVDRLAALGEMAVELLTYFAHNPGDKAVHAEYVLGYPLVEINKLLNGSLGFYVRRARSGGWECHAWVSDVLAALAQRSR